MPWQRRSLQTLPPKPRCNCKDDITLLVFCFGSGPYIPCSLLKANSGPNFFGHPTHPSLSFSYFPSPSGVSLFGVGYIEYEIRCLCPECPDAGLKRLRDITDRFVNPRPGMFPPRLPLRTSITLFRVQSENLGLKENNPFEICYGCS